MNAWEKRRQTITADELFRTPIAPDPSHAYSPPPPPAQGWFERKLKNAEGWPWREVILTIGACVLGAAAFTFIGSLDLTWPSVPRRTEIMSTITATPVIVERVVTAGLPPVVIVVTSTPQPSKPQQHVQRAPVRSMPAPASAPPAAKLSAPPTGTAKGSMGYQCADGRYFPAGDGRWAWFGFGQWIANGTGDEIDIRDTADAGDGKLGWHYKCQRVWR